MKIWLFFLVIVTVFILVAGCEPGVEVQEEVPQPPSLPDDVVEDDVEMAAGNPPAFPEDE